MFSASIHLAEQYCITEGIYVFKSCKVFNFHIFLNIQLPGSEMYINSLLLNPHCHNKSLLSGIICESKFNPSKQIENISAIYLRFVFLTNCIF